MPLDLRLLEDARGQRNYDTSLSSLLRFLYLSADYLYLCLYRTSLEIG